MAHISQEYTGPATGERWTNASEKCVETVRTFIDDYDMPYPIACCLAARGITPESQYLFFNAKLNDLSNPFLFRDMGTAVKRIWQAVKNKENILIYGDYDTDGLTSTALLSEILDHEGAKITPYIPHRFEDGSGFNIESLDRAIAAFPADSPCKLLITVDCGIYGHDTVQHARELGIDAVITDHHEPHADCPPPDAIAVLNPKLDPKNVPGIADLCGAGVAFKLAHAFLLYGRKHKLTETGESVLLNVLDYVALGTVADIVSLTGENRIFVRYGLKIIHIRPRPGIAALLETAELKAEDISSAEITFKIAPRINAAGRLENAALAYRLLTAKTPDEARPIARDIEAINAERHDLEFRIYELAREKLVADPEFRNKKTSVAAGENWHRGVIGIVASKLAAEFKRPTLIVSVYDGIAHGSVRSVPGINLMNVFAQFRDLIPTPQYGGHSMAIGFDLPQDKLEALTARFEEAVSRELLQSNSFGVFDYDGEITMSDLNSDFFEYYHHLEPFGQGNRPPLFLIRNLRICRIYPKKTVSIRGVITDDNGNTLDFITSDCLPPADAPIDVIARPQAQEGSIRFRNRIILLAYRLCS